MKHVPRSPDVSLNKNVVDRVVEFFSPEAGSRRLMARAALALAGGYLGGKTDRRFTKNWKPGNGDANSDTIWDLQVLRARSRDACRNQPMALGLKNTLLTYTIGTGLLHHARPRWDFLPIQDEKLRTDWQVNTERKFLSFCESREFDVERRLNFWQMQRLAFASRFESGDVFALLAAKPRATSRYALAVQLIEADRVCNPDGKPNSSNIIEGIELNPDGSPNRIHVLSQHPGSLISTTRSWTQYDVDGPWGRRNVLHLFDMLRPGQVRGVPGLAPFLEQLKNADDYRDAEQKAAIVASWFTILLKSENGGGFSLGSGVPGVPGTGSASQDPASPELGPGIIARMKSGDDAVIVNPGRPNANFGPFMQSITEQVGQGSGMPYEVLLHHYSSSFSASKAAQEDAYRACLPIQQAFADDFCQEIYCAWLSEAVAIGDVIAPGYFEDPEVRRAWQGSEWVGDSRISIDPNKEATAIETRLRIGLTDLAQEIASYSGRSVEDVIAQRAKERKLQLAAGLIQDPPAPGTAPSPAPAKDKMDPKDPNEGDEE